MRGAPNAIVADAQRLALGRNGRELIRLHKVVQRDSPAIRVLLFSVMERGKGHAAFRISGDCWSSDLVGYNTVGRGVLSRKAISTDLLVEVHALHAQRAT